MSIKRLFILLCGIAFCPILTAQQSDSALSQPLSESTGDSPTGALSLGHALALAEKHNPDLTIYSTAIRTREALRLQAGLRPNPSLQVEVEDFGKSRGASFNDAETTVSLGQMILLGGKRQKNVRVSQGEVDSATWDYRVAQRLALTFTAQAFTDVLTAQEQLTVAQNAQTLASNLLATVTAQVEAGKVSSIEKLRASAIHSAKRAAFRAAGKELDIRRARLASAWGDSQASFDRAVRTFEDLTPLPNSVRLLDFLDDHPTIARWENEQSLRRSRLDVQKARRIPNLTVRGGARRFESSDSTGFTLSVSLPLPLINRNQGNIAAAQSELTAAAQGEAAARVKIRTALIAARRSLEAASQNATAYRDEIIPSSEEAFELSREAYRQGKLGLIDVLDTQRLLFEARAEYVDALAKYHKARTEVEGLIGRPLESIDQQTNTENERNQNDR